MNSITFPIAYEGYRICDQIVDEEKMAITIRLEHKSCKEYVCHECSTQLTVKRGQHALHLKELSIMGFKVFVHLFRRKGFCPSCKKARSEKIDFLSEQTPHATRNYSHWLGKLCEIATSFQAAWFAAEDKSTTFRADLERMEEMFRYYCIPFTDKIAVDEVYIGKVKEAGENRNDRFFTIITDINTGKVIWVTRSRRKAALDSFFEKVGKKYCNGIKVIVTDQHEDYLKSSKQYLKNAVHVLDKFHIIRNFEEALNDCRKNYRKAHLDKKNRKEEYDLTSGKYRFIFLKKASKRTAEEQAIMDSLHKVNKLFLDLELIKERMLTFFNARDTADARRIFIEIRSMIWEVGFPELKRWWTKLNTKWELLKNYFTEKVTTAISEGVNHVIKSLKRRSFGFRKLRYFELKILQRCGFLNSRFMRQDGTLTEKARDLLGLPKSKKKPSTFHEVSLI